MCDSRDKSVNIPRGISAVLLAAISILPITGCTEGSSGSELIQRIAKSVFHREPSRLHRRKEKLYKVQPYINYFTPTVGPANTSVIIEIHGLDFLLVPRVVVGISDAAVLFRNDNYLIVETAPQPAGIADIIVFNANNRSAVRRAAFQFYDGTPPPPVITAVDPPEVPWGFGNRVSLLGVGFRENARVFFNDVESGDVFVESCSKVVARTPFSGTGPVVLSILNPDGGCASVSTMFAYSDWSTQPHGGNVLARRQYLFAEDSAAGLLVAFGGYEKGYTDDYSDVNITWLFNGAQYVRGMTGEPNPARFDFALAPNPGGGVVLFGGLGEGRELSDTWIYSGGAWTQAAPMDSPSPRSRSAAAFFGASNEAIIFGGAQGYFLLDDTWAWGGTNWRRITTANSPSPRKRFAITADEAAGVIVLFGGDTAYGMSGETWIFDGADWTLTPAAGPAPRIDASAAYDTNSSRIILFGGSDGFTVFDDTWFYDVSANSWTWVFPMFSPSARLGAAIAADHARGRVVLHGGFRRENGALIIENDTWEWDGASWVETTPPISP